MRVDVQMDDDELALLSGYSRSTSMGIKKPGELQKELLSDMENIEEKRMSTVPEGETMGEAESKDETASAAEERDKSISEGETESVSEGEAESAPVGVRADFLSMLSKMAHPDTSEDSEGESKGIPSEDSEEDWDDGELPADDEDDEDEDVSTLPADDDEGADGTLPTDDDEDEDEDVSMLPADDEEDEGADGVATEEPTTGITDDDEDYSSELPEDDDDEEYSSELPEDEDEEEDSEEYSSELSDDEEDGDESEVLPSDEDQIPSVGISEHSQDAPIVPDVVEKSVSNYRRSHKLENHANSYQPPQPVGYSSPSVSLYDFILNNGGSMPIEDVRKYYPADEVKKALNLGKIYRFGNKVGV